MITRYRLADRLALNPRLVEGNYVTHDWIVTEHNVELLKNWPNLVELEQADSINEFTARDIQEKVKDIPAVFEESPVPEQSVEVAILELPEPTPETVSEVSNPQAEAPVDPTTLTKRELQNLAAKLGLGEAEYLQMNKTKLLELVTIALHSEDK